MSSSALGIFGRCTLKLIRTQFHTSGRFQSKKAVKRYRSVKHSLDFQAQKQVLIDLVKTGSLDGLETVKENAINAGHAMDRVSFDSHFLQTCSELGAFELGKDYFNRLYSEGRAGVGVIGKFFSMCQAHRARCNSGETKFLLKIYDDLVTKHGVFDAMTCEHLAKGIFLTNRWKLELPRLVEMVNRSDASPSSSLLSTAVDGALYQRDVEAAWEYMNLFLQYDKPLLPDTFEVVIKYGNQLPRLLRWMEENGVLLVKESAEVFLRLGASQNAEVKLSRVPHNGVCQSCRRPLNPSLLTNAEFDRLRNAFLDPVLIGRDVFLKSRPEELIEYQHFLDTVLPVDVVLDGLNIAYASRQPSQSSKLLRSVTSHFAAKSKSILIIGRKHMKKWPAKDLNFIHDRAKVFLAEDISQDDPFLLYGTLRSGIMTKFVSRDRMSSHRFLLKAPDLRRIFSKWQALRQYHPLHISSDGSEVALRDPSKFIREPQNTNDRLWHLPVVDHSQTQIEGHLKDEHSPWLCIRL